MNRKIGLAGAGMVSYHHLLAWQSQRPRAEVVAIADPGAAQAAERASAFGVGATFSDARTMMDTVALDALDVAAPREVHAQIVGLAAERGIPVLCQKPLAPTLVEAEALARFAGPRTRLMVHENWRFRPYYRELKAWLDDGAIGRVHQCRMSALTSALLPQADGVRPALARQPFLKTEKRLLVMEVLIHHIDTLRFLLGPMTVETAAIARLSPDLAGEDCATVCFRSASGASVVLIGNFLAHGHPPALIDDLEFIGDRGAITLRNGRLKLSGPADREQSYDLADSYQASFNRTIGHFLDCLDSGAPFETNPEDNLQTLKLVETIYAMSAGSASDAAPQPATAAT